MGTNKQHENRSHSGKRHREKMGGPEKIEIPAEEYKDLQARADSASEYHDKMLRALADLENSRKRLEKEKQEFCQLANQELINELLPVLDNFERALDSAPSTKTSNPYFQGVEMIYKQLKEVLIAQGLEEIKAEGEHFDPYFHEAVQQEVTDSCPDGTVLKVLLKGYLFRGKLLRPAVVKVSQYPASAVPEGEEKIEPGNGELSD